jgi:hypothetical protein
MAPRKKPTKSKAKTQAAARKKKGGSNVGKYKGVKAFAGPSGGAPKGSFPINTLKRAKSALKLAHNAPRPGGIKAAVYRKYPSLKPKTKKSTKKRTTRKKK